MAIEQLSESTYRFEPGPIDVHAHPRAFDAVTDDAFIDLNGGHEGKAGLALYTSVALRSGITAMIMMPNEQLRLYDVNEGGRTKLVPFPISNHDRVLVTEALISQQAVEPVAIHFGVDPEEIFYDKQRMRLDRPTVRQRFSEVGDEVTSLKLYGDETTGGYNVPPRFLPSIISIWHELHPTKPVVLHLEDENVAHVLYDVSKLPEGRDSPLHIAHISSQEELEAVITAKQAGMNVTCEVTVHHLFLDSAVREEVGGYGCVKPTLKTQADIDFLWANMRYIDIIASDCAPHRRSDKEAENPANGVTTHTVMLPLLFGAISEGKLTVQELDQKFCINPRKRFGLPLKDGSFVEYETAVSQDAAKDKRLQLEQYGYNPFLLTKRRFHMIGQVAAVQAGVSRLQESRPSYTHVIRPKNLNFSAVQGM